MADDPLTAELNTLRDRLAKRAAKLIDYEAEWRDRQVFLEKHGYMLRPRYHPEWVPSWLSNGKHAEECEDFVKMPVRPLFVFSDRC